MTPNKTEEIYVIQQPSRRRGLFSLVASVICHVDYALKNQMQPYVDFLDSPTFYNDGEIAGTRNSWEYYFEPVSQITRYDLEKGKKVFSDHGFPDGYDYTLQNNAGLFERTRHLINVRTNVAECLQSNSHLVGKNTLGVQFRGQEIKYFRGHYLPPTKKQMRDTLVRLIERFNFNSVFVVSEDQSHIDFILDVSPVPVKFTNAFRLNGQNSYSVYPREHHRYLLGLEVLLDALLLSKCDGLIHCTSNVAQFSRFYCRDKFTVRAEILNWKNTKIIPLNYFAWPLFNLAAKLDQSNNDKFVSYHTTEID